MTTNSEEKICDSSNSVEDSDVIKTEAAYVETPVKDETFSRVFSAYKRQSAGVVKEYKNKQEYRSRSERKKIKAETARKRNAKRARQNERRFGRKYF